MQKIPYELDALKVMKKYPPSLSYEGDLKLLEKIKVSIVGTRRPSQYTRNFTHQCASALTKAGLCIVSGGAIGVDAIAHLAAGAKNTIAVLPCGIDLKYPSINKNLLTQIGQEGLLVSQFEPSFQATPWSFVLRNELVVALGDILIVAEADHKSGSMRSVEFALEMGKEIFVLPHRIGESAATNKLLQENKAQAIYDVESFVGKILAKHSLEANLMMQTKADPFRELCKSTPTYEALFKAFPDRVFEAELNGEIIVKNGKVFLA